VFDSHCHLHDRSMDAEAAIARAREAGVRGFLLAGVDPDGWRDEDRIARAHPDVAVAYGVHPQLVAEVDDAETERMVAALSATLSACRDGGSPLVAPAAIGEIGLDGAGERRDTLDRQERAFRAQLRLAREHDLPVVLHVLRAHGRALAILREERLPRRGGVLHSYSGPAEMVRDYVALGLHLAFAGPVTLARSKKTHAAARCVPPERLLVETDAPFQSPEPYRPGPCEPAFLVAIVEALAQIRGEPAAHLAAYTEENARRLLGL
jgi:TatD DNase family protein